MPWPLGPRSEDKRVKVTIAANAAGTGRPGINHNPEFGEAVVLANSIIYGNSRGDAIHVPDTNLIQASYSDLQGGWPGTGNIDADPMFVDAGNGDYHLRPGSPAIDAGAQAGARPCVVMVERRPR